jgi:hypothetical protein
MHRKIVVSLILAVLVLTALSMPKPAHANATVISYNLTCSSFSATGTTTAAYLGIQAGSFFAGFPASGGIGSGTITFGAYPEGTVFSIYVYDASDLTGNYAGGSLFAANVPCPSSFNWTGTAPLPLFTDGRENKNDALQTAAVYCGVPNSGDVRVYALFNNVGSIAFTVTKAQLAAGVQKPSSPYLIKSGKGAELWRLQDGSLRIKRGTYVFDWPGC